MMSAPRFLAVALAGAIGLGMFGTSPALANGAASTRNIILGGAAASLLILNHNKKVHEHYAADQARVSELDQARAWERSRYEAAQANYQNEVARNAQFRHQVALQHGEIVRLRRELAQADGGGRVGRAHAQKTSRTLASASLGWGTL